jgi:hypothetical protein
MLRCRSRSVSSGFPNTPMLGRTLAGSGARDLRTSPDSERNSEHIGESSGPLEHFDASIAQGNGARHNGMPRAPNSRKIADMSSCSKTDMMLVGSTLAQAPNAEWVMSSPAVWNRRLASCIKRIAGVVTRPVDFGRPLPKKRKALPCFEPLHAWDGEGFHNFSVGAVEELTNQGCARWFSCRRLCSLRL